jgi:hypothetical protein
MYIIKHTNRSIQGDANNKNPMVYTHLTFCVIDLFSFNNLHHGYRKAKDTMFSEIQIFNKEAFVLILSEIWDNFATKAVLQKAAKRDGITPLLILGCELYATKQVR